MKQLFILIIIVYTAFPVVNAQQMRFEREKSPEAEAIILAGLQQHIFLVEQYYCLQGASGRRYGQNDNEYFGHDAVLAIIADSTLYADDRILHPWKNDTDYNAYESVDSLSPVGTTSLFYSATSLLTVDTAELRFRDTIDFQTIKVLRFNKKQDTLNQPGLHLVSNEKTDIPAFFVIAHHDSSSTKGLKFKLSILFSDMIDLSPEGNKPNILNAPSKEGFIGGFYIKPQLSNNGVGFSLAGIVEYKGRIFRMRPFETTEIREENNSGTLNPVDD